MSEKELKSFPSTYVEALAMIYMNTLNLNGKSPEEILHIYKDAYARIKAERDKADKNWF